MLKAFGFGLALTVAIAPSLAGCKPFVHSQTQPPSSTAVTSAAPDSSVPGATGSTASSANTPRVLSEETSPGNLAQTAEEAIDKANDARIKQAIRDAIIQDPIINAHRRWHQNRLNINVSSPIQVLAIAHVAAYGGYALADWGYSVGDLPIDGHALLVNQAGRWFVVTDAVGNSSQGASAKALTELKVPREAIQPLMSTFRAAGATLDDSPFVPLAPIPCKTVTSDPNPPTNLRAAPKLEPDNILSQIPNGTVVTVTHTLNDWVKLRQPSLGWVSLNLLEVSCGNSLVAVKANLATLQAQILAGTNGHQPADTLMRYLLRGADGAYTEVALITFEKVAQESPAALINVLDFYSEAARRSLLQLVIQNGMAPEARSRFAEELARSGNSPTRQTWNTLHQK